MVWQIDEGLGVQEECHFGDRAIRCFARRPKSVDALLRDASRRSGNRPAIVDGDLRMSYDELNSTVDQIAANLTAVGVGQHDRIALLLTNSADFILMIFAAARIGAISVPINIRSQTQEIAYILDHAAAKVLVYDAVLNDRLPSLSGVGHRYSVGGSAQGAPSFETLLAKSSAQAPASLQAEEDDVTVILYTSGTTGKPKGAMLTHLNIAHSVMHFELCMGLGDGECSVLAVPASHITGLVANILTMVRTAGCLVVLRHFEASAFLDLAAREKMTHTVLVPAMYNLCLLRADFEQHDLSPWRIGCYGGAPMPEATIAVLAEKMPNLILMNAYGSTETCSPSTLMPPGGTSIHSNSVGIAVPLADIKIVNKVGDEVERGETGEIWIKGPMVIPGYWNDPAKTQEGFSDGYWKSGDIGSIDGAGFVYLHDRIKDVIIRGGYNVYSAELENTLSHHPRVIECAAIGHPDPVLGEKIHLFLRAGSKDLVADDICQFCAERLADYKVPDFVTFLDEPLPRNANGKIMKNVLRDRIIGEANQR